MKIFDVIRISMKNTFRNIKKTILSSAAVAIGIASVVLISSVGNGVYRLAENELKKLGIDGLSMRIESSEDLTLEPSYVKLIEENVPGVKSAMPFSIYFSSSRILKTTNKSVIWGVGTKMIETMDLNLLHGMAISVADISSNARVAVIDEEQAFNVYRRSNVVGKIIRLYINEKWEDFTIIGIISSQTEAIKSIIGTDIGTFVYIPYTTFNELNNNQGVSQIAVSCADGFTPSAVAISLELYMSRVYPVNGKYVVENITGYLERVKDIVRLIKLLITAIGSISLVVAGVGVMNGILASIEQRKKEIGIYLAVGAFSGDIVKNIMLEAIIVCVIGGLTGSLFGIGGSVMINTMLNLPVGIEAGDLMVAFILSCVCGILFGVFPALKAARLDPIDILNKE